MSEPKTEPRFRMGDEAIFHVPLEDAVSTFHRARSGQRVRITGIPYRGIPGASITLYGDTMYFVQPVRGGHSLFVKECHLIAVEEAEKGEGDER